MNDCYFSFRLPAKFLALCFCLLASMAAMAQNGAIKGKIRTSDGTPAAYVNVAVKELPAKGTLSEQNGNYSLTNLQPGAYTIVISRIGLADQTKNATVTAKETTVLDFELTENISQLREVEIAEIKTPNQRAVGVGKSAIKPMDLPQSVSVVGEQVIADQQASKLSDVIKNVNGVSLGTTRGATAETFFARGYNLGANNIMKNGARSNSAVIPEASTLEKVEVLKGSAALLYGNVSSGAVINMVTKKPQFNWGGEVSMRAGSYNMYKPIVDVYGPVSQNLAFRVIGTAEKADSYRDQVKSERLYVNPSLLYKLGSRTDILVQADYLKHNFTPDFGIGTLADTVIPTSIPRNAFFNTGWAFNNVNQTNASVTIDHRLTETWKLNVLAARQEFDRDYYSTERIQAKANGDWDRNLTRSKIGENYYNGQANLTGEFRTGKIEHSLLVGLDAERYMNISNTYTKAVTKTEKVKQPDGTEKDVTTTTTYYLDENHTDQVVKPYDKINILDPNKFTPRTDMFTMNPYSRTETPTMRYGIFAQNLVSLSQKLKVLVGLRWSYQDIAAAKTIDLEKGTETKGKPKTDKAFSPRVGLVYQPTPTTSLFASYSNNFSPNTGTDIYLNNLKASIIDQYEMGIKNDLIKGKLSANFTVYRIVNDDLAINAPFDKDGKPNSSSTLKQFAGETTSDGAELDLTGTILPGLNFLAGYSYNFMRFTKTSGERNSYIVGERLVSNPAHTGNASVFYTFQNGFIKGLKVGASAFYTGKRNGGWNNTVDQKEKYNRLIPVSSFTTFDVSAGYTYKKVSLMAKLSNITNELNYLVHENYSVNPIAPRMFTTTVSYKF